MEENVVNENGGISITSAPTKTVYQTRTVIAAKDDAEKLAELGRLLGARRMGPKRNGNMAAGLRFLVRVVLPEVLEKFQDEEDEDARRWKTEMRYIWDDPYPIVNE